MTESIGITIVVALSCGMATLVSTIAAIAMWTVRDVAKMNGALTAKERIGRDNWMQQMTEKLLAIRTQEQERIAALHAQERVIERTNNQVTDRMVAQVEAAMNHQPAAVGNDFVDDSEGIPVMRPEDAAGE